MQKDDRLATCWAGFRVADAKHAGVDFSERGEGCVRAGLHGFGSDWHLMLSPQCTDAACSMTSATSCG